MARKRHTVRIVLQESRRDTAVMVSVHVMVAGDEEFLDMLAIGASIAGEHLVPDVCQSSNERVPPARRSACRMNGSSKRLPFSLTDLNELRPRRAPGARIVKSLPLAGR